MRRRRARARPRRRAARRRASRRRGSARVTAAPRPPVPPVMSALRAMREPTPLGSSGPSAALATVSPMFVKDLQEGAAVDGVLVVREAELRAERDGGAVPAPRCSATAPAALPANVCDDVEAASAIATVGAPVHVSGRLQVAQRPRRRARAARAAAPRPRARSTRAAPARRPAALGRRSWRPTCASSSAPSRTATCAALLDAVFGPRRADLGALPQRAGGQALPPGLPPRAARALAVGRAGRQRDQRDVRRHRPRRRRRRRAAARHRQARRLRVRRATAIEMTDAGKLQGEIPLGYYRVRRADRRHRRLRPAHRRGRAAHHPQPPRQPRARQPGRAVHARGDARALLRQPRRPAGLVRPAREGAAVGRALVALRPRDRRRRVLRAPRTRARRAQAA